MFWKFFFEVVPSRGHGFSIFFPYFFCSQIAINWLFLYVELLILTVNFQLKKQKTKSFVKNSKELVCNCLLRNWLLTSHEQEILLLEFRLVIVICCYFICNQMSVKMMIAKKGYWFHILFVYVSNEFCWDDYLNIE